MANKPIGPKEFNGLYLPVRWVSDDKNPGIIDQDEIWTHPNLLAINAYQEKVGGAPVDSYELAQRVFGKLKMSDDTHAYNSIIAKDIDTRARVDVRFNVGDMPEGPYKQAIIELVKAVAFADLYYNLQKDPAYLEHLNEIISNGSVLQMRLFFQNSGLRCVANDDSTCTALPDARADLNGIWWPDDISKDDIKFLLDGYEWQDDSVKRKVLTPGSCIVEAKKNEPDSFLFKDKWYRAVSINHFQTIKVAGEMIANHIEKAGNIIENVNPALGVLLRKKAEFIRTAPIFGDLDLDKLWVEVNDKNLIFSFGSIESYEAIGSPDRIKAVMEGLVAYADLQLQNFIDDAKRATPMIDEEFWRLWESSGEEFPIEKQSTNPPDAMLVKVIFSSGSANSAGYVGGGFSLPNYNNYSYDVSGEDLKSKSVLYGDIMTARVRFQGLPIARLAFDDRTVKALEKSIDDVKPISIFCYAHEENHNRPIATVPVYVKSLDKKISFEGAIGEGDMSLAYAMEEGAADLLGLFELAVLNKKGLLNDEQMKTIYYAYLGSLLRDLNLGEDDEHVRGSIMEFRLLADHGVVTYDQVANKYGFDLKKMSESIPAIAKQIMDVYFTFDKAQLEQFDKKARDFFDGSPIKRFAEQARQTGMPSENLPYYRVEGDLGKF